eukprot:1161534-Pelagomonas_calceolata.AAC.5
MQEQAFHELESMLAYRIKLFMSLMVALMVPSTARHMSESLCVDCHCQCTEHACMRTGHSSQAPRTWMLSAREPRGGVHAQRAFNETLCPKNSGIPYKGVLKISAMHVISLHALSLCGSCEAQLVCPGVKLRVPPALRELAAASASPFTKVTCLNGSRIQRDDREWEQEVDFAGPRMSMMMRQVMSENAFMAWVAQAALKGCCSVQGRALDFASPHPNLPVSNLCQAVPF